MPVINSTYRPPFLFGNGHIQTIFPAKFREVAGVNYQRERVPTPDEDFIDIDWSKTGSKKLAIVLHGYEGHTFRDYMLGIVKAFNKRTWDGVAVNLRGCSGEPNLKVKSYNAGSSDDLAFIINYVFEKYEYSHVALIGFSLGGNITLKYIGECGEHIDPRIKAAVCFSVPCHLKSSAVRVSAGIYNRYFLDALYKKMKQKSEVMPGEINMEHFHKVKTLIDYDHYYAVPINNFGTTDNYYSTCSSLNFFEQIKLPTLLVNAKNDPMLAEDSYPFEVARNHKYLYLEVPKSGGHTGFIRFNKRNEYWSESRALEFVSRIVEDDL